MTQLPVYAIPLLCAFAASVALTPAVRGLALRWRLVDAAGGARKVHARAIPRLGGIAIVSGFFAAIAIGFVFNPAARAEFRSRGPIAIAFLLGAAAIALVGLVDDVRSLRARHKLLAQVVISTAVCLSGFAIRSVELPPGIVVSLGDLSVPLTVLWMVGVMNAINLIDGLDGLAGGVSMIALAGVLFMCHLLGKPVMGMYAIALIGSLGGFLVYNFNPASVFMGDAGSLFLGYVLAVASISVSRSTAASTSDFSMSLTMLAIPLVDTVLAIGRRLLRGVPVFSADKEHLHHRLLELGLTQRQSVLLLYVVGAACSVAAIVIRVTEGFVELGWCVAIATAAFAGLAWLGVFRLNFTNLRADRESNGKLLTGLREISESVSRARALDEVVDALQKLGPVVGASTVKVRIGATARLHSVTLDPKSVEAMFALRAGSRRVGDVLVVWDDGRAKVEQQHALAIEQMCENVAHSVSRMVPEDQVVLTPAVGLSRVQASGSANLKS